VSNETSLIKVEIKDETKRNRGETAGDCEVLRLRVEDDVRVTWAVCTARRLN